MNDNNLKCSNCGTEVPFEPQNSRCPSCGEPLEFKQIMNGSISRTTLGSSFMKRYSEFYPFLDVDKTVSLGEGNTALVKCGAMVEKYGFEQGTLFIKNETQNPTWSFKDRGTVIGANFAKAKGYNALGVISSANNAASCAAYAAALGMKAFVFVPAHILEEKVLPIEVYGATVIKVDGDYSELYYLSKELEAKYGIYFANSDVPTRVEGTKSIAFEISEQMDFNPPEWILLPTGSGGNLRGIEKGFNEFKAAGLIDHVPKIVAVQPEGCCPIYKAYTNNSERISHIGKTYKTIAMGTANPNPPSGNQLLRMIKEGRIDRIAMVPEKDILTWHREMASCGIFAQPESCMPFGAAKQMLDEGIIKKGERVVLIATGGGLKVTSVLSETTKHTVYQEKLDKLDDLLSTLI